MKQRILLLTVFAGILYLTLSSTATGPAQFDGDRTGRLTLTCAAVGCHTAGAGATTCSIEVRKKSTGSSGSIVSAYVPDSVYTITLKGTNAAKPKFGFQLTAVHNGNAAGIFSNLPTNTHSATVSTVPIIEHTAALSKAASGSDSVSFDWKAPADSSVTFYGIVNAVDGNNASTNDAVSTPASIVLQKATSVAAFDKNVIFTAYPNPFTSQLTLKMEHAPEGEYTVIVTDLRGTRIAIQKTGITSAASNYVMQTDSWPTGYYMIQVMKDCYSKLIPAIKR